MFIVIKMKKNYMKKITNSEYLEFDEESFFLEEDELKVAA